MLLLLSWVRWWDDSCCLCVYEHVSVLVLGQHKTTHYTSVTGSRRKTCWTTCMLDNDDDDDDENTETNRQQAAHLLVGEQEATVGKVIEAKGGITVSLSVKVHKDLANCSSFRGGVENWYSCQSSISITKIELSKKVTQTTTKKTMPKIVDHVAQYYRTVHIPVPM